MSAEASEENQSAPEESAPPRGILAFLDRFLGRFIQGPLPEERRYWILVPLTGLAAGLFAVASVRFLALVQGAFWGVGYELREGVIGTAPWLRILIPTLGGVLVVLIGWIHRRSGAIEGLAHLIELLVRGKARPSLGSTVIDGLVSITAVGMGASLGREGALIQTGAASGAWLGKKLKVSEYRGRILLVCGAAGGIAAAYNVPIGASVFAMEVLLRSFAMELFGPIIICSVIATSVSRALIADVPAYQIPAYTFFHWEIVLYLLLGIFIGLASALFIKVFSSLDTLFAWFRRIDPIKPIVAMAALGVAGVYFPDLFGNGYATVNLALKGDLGASVKLLLLLPVLKMFFTALCRAGGIPGGLFTPSIFVGVLLGCGFRAVVALLLPWSVSPPGAYGLIGMGAILAGTMQAPITAILLVFEMTNDYQVILPLMTACIASALVSHALQAGSLITEPLRRRGVILPENLAPAWMRQAKAWESMVPDTETIQASERFESVMEKFLRSSIERDRLFVLDRDGRYLGAISLHEIKLFFRESAHLDSVIAVDMLDGSFPSVTAEDPVSRAIEILAERDAERIPVLEAESRKFLGCIAKRQLLAVYQQSNLARLQGVDPPVSAGGPAQAPPPRDLRPGGSL